VKYKTLYQDDDVEVRKYPPVNRTLLSRNHSKLIGHFVPFPYQVYTAVRSKISGGRLLYTAFAKADDKFLYATPFRSVDVPVCIDMRWHVVMPDDVDMGEAVGRYLSTYFPPYIGSRLRHLLQVESYQEYRN